MKVKFTRLAAILLYLWQLPQNLVGLLLVTILRPEDCYEMEGAKLCYASRMRGGISLGRYIIIHSTLKDFTGNTERHELGHAKQSRMLGWFYLFVIGIPSLLWAAWWNDSRPVSYYSFYTERWADHLGGVNRDD